MADIYYNGEKISQLDERPVQKVQKRAKNGEWRGNKFHLFIKRSIAAILILMAFNSWGPLIWGKPQNVQAETVTVNYTPEKLESLKDDVVNEVAGCESAGHKESDGIIIFDSNNQPSIGQLQFQRKTVIHYMKVLDNKTIDSKEAVEIAIDTTKAKALAKRIIFEKGGIDNWHNCSVKLGLSTEVKLIQKLSQ